MYRKLLLSSLAACCCQLMSVALYAQYSFSYLYGGDEDNRIEGIKQIRNGNFCFYGSHDLGNHIGVLDEDGNIIWEMMYNERSEGDVLNDFTELPNGDFFIAGVAGWQIQQINARVSIFTPDGVLKFDKIYPVRQSGSGSAIKMIDNKKHKYIATIGFGSLEAGNPTTYIYQKTDYAGKRLWYNYVYGAEGHRLTGFFKYPGKEEYLIFSDFHVTRIDSMGKIIGPVQSAIGTNLGGEIYDILQNEDGTYTSLGYRPKNKRAGFYLQKHDSNGHYLSCDTLICEINDTMSFQRFCKTKDKGFLMAGSHLLLLDSNGKYVWCLKLKDRLAMQVRKVGQAADGGFYGCGYDNTNAREPEWNYDFFVFKTTPDGQINTGLQYPGKPVHARVFPNPASDVVHIALPIRAKEIEVRCYNTAGVLKLQSFEHNRQEISLGIRELPQGIYTIQVLCGDTQYFSRVIKE